jgi:hypothetical protein
MWTAWLNCHLQRKLVKRILGSDFTPNKCQTCKKHPDDVHARDGLWALGQTGLPLRRGSVDSI